MHLSFCGIVLVKNLENRNRLRNNFDEKEHDYFSMLCCAILGVFFSIFCVFSKNMKIGVVANTKMCIFIYYEFFGLIFTLAFVVVGIQIL
jgi:hypothetical protein